MSKCIIPSKFYFPWTNFIPFSGAKKIQPKKLQFFSDIHLERRKNIPKFEPFGDYCVVLGDIGDPFSDNYKDFIHSIGDKFDKSITIAGNHEYWQTDPKKCYQAVTDQIRRVHKDIPNVTFLNNDMVHLNGYTFLGTTLWTKLASNTMNIDGNNIFITPNKIADAKSINDLHKRSVDWLKSHLEFYYNHNIIVLTHHLPSHKLISPKFNTKRWKPYQQRYANHLDHLMHPNIHYWLCGHSHCQLGEEINGVKCFINSHGYPHEKPDNVDIETEYINLHPI